MWHVSTSWQPPGWGAVPITEWTSEQRAKARRWCLDALDGVGAGDLWHESESGRVLHLRRPFRQDELSLLDPAWLALPAVDLGGGEGLLQPDWR